jgi:hypothetical protein
MMNKNNSTVSHAIAMSFKEIASSPVFMQDAATLATIPSNQFDQAIDALSNKSLGSESLLAYVKTFIEGEECIGAVVNFLVNFERIKDGYSLSTEEALPIFSPIVDEVLSDKDVSGREVFSRRLPSLAADYDIVKKDIKLNELRREASSSLEKFLIICDIRPLFNEEADQVEALVPYTTMHLQFDSAGTSHAFDIRLSDSQVEDMLDKLLRAKKKSALVRSLIDNSKIAL